MAVLQKPETRPGRRARGGTTGERSGGSSGRRGRRSTREAGPTPFVPTMPTVDLLPAEVREGLEVRRLRRMFVLLAVGAVALLGVAWTLQAGMIALAQRQLDDENATAATLGAELSALAPVKTYYAQIESYRATIQTTMANEVLPSRVVAEVDRTAPPGVQVDTIGMTFATGPVDPAAGAAVTTCPNPDPFTAPTATAGCVAISGTAASRVPVGELIDRLEANPMFTSVFVSTAAAGGDGLVTFTGSVGLAADKAFSGRYADETFLEAGGDR